MLCRFYYGLLFVDVEPERETKVRRCSAWGRRRVVYSPPNIHLVGGIISDNNEGLYSKGATSRALTSWELPAKGVYG